jgi:hypothetical protein
LFFSLISKSSTPDTGFSGELRVKIQTSTTKSNLTAANVINDTICGAIELMIDSPYVTGNTALASLSDSIDPYLASIGCTCSVLNNTLWYKFHAATSMNTAFIRLKTDSTSTFYSWLNVFVAGNMTSTCTGNLIFLGCQTGPNSAVGIDSLEIPLYGVQAGTDYYLMIDGYSGATGEISIAIRSDTTVNTIDIINAFSELSIFPNPAEKFIYIQSKLEITHVNLSIINIYGQEVYYSFFSSLINEKLALANLTTGVYFLVISGEKGSFYKKIIVR